MGTNCCVRLNEGADWHKVGEVACVLLGAKKHREPAGRNGWRIFVEGFGYGKFRHCSIPEYVDVMGVGDKENPVLKAIESTDCVPYPLCYGLESRGLYPKATAEKIALAEGITKFFGGRIVYNDCTDRKRTFKTLIDFKGESDKAFYRYQTALEKLKPLTQKDIDRNAKYAAY